MLSAAQVQQFKRDGFLLGGRVVSDEQVDVLLEEMQRVIRDQDNKDVPQPVQIVNLFGREDAPIWQIVNIFHASKPFRELMFNKKVIEEIAQLADAKQLRIWHDQIQYKPSAGGGHSLWHQDAPYWSTLTPNDEMVTAWIALDDVDVDNGCMRMMPGTHKWGDQIEYLHKIKDFYNPPTEYQGHKLEVQMRPVKKGHVHYHHSLTWHGSGENKSNRPRRAIALHYMTERCRYAASGHHPMKPYIKVADGEMMQGDAFPLVWEKERELVTA